MKIITRIISLLMVALMLTTSVPFMSVSAVDDGMEEYTFTVENTYSDSSLAENSAVGGVAFFGSTEFDGCYGNQLSGVAKELYDSLVKKFVTGKVTGEYTYTFKTPFVFDAEFSGGAFVENEEYKEVKLEISCAMQTAMDAFLYDHPEIFWLKLISTAYRTSFSGSSYGYEGTIEKITVEPIQIYSGASAKASQYNAAVESALDSITVTESRYDTLKSVHDYICNNAWYNLSSEYRVHSSEPFFIGDGGVVCEGYAKTFKVLCDRLEIPCVLVSGDAGGAHMWNYVQMDDGKWYLVDATWDDQESKIYDTYFLANANTVGFDGVPVSQERTENNDFSGTGIFSFTYPVLTSSGFDSHVHEWDSDYTVDVEPTCIEKGSKSIHCKGCDETKSVTEMPATNHANKTEYTQQDATCTENGYTAGIYCNDCEEWISGYDIIPVLPHTPGTTVIENRVEPKCEVKGSYDEAVYCLVCNTELSREKKEISALTHIWDEGVINPVSTCKTHGTMTYTCQNDKSHKKTEKVALDSSNHEGGTYLKNEAEPTCTEDGYTGDTYCSGCNVKLSTGEIIPATNHPDAETAEQVEATCTSTGYTAGTYCPDCKEWIDGHEEISVLPHTPGTTVIENRVEPKCEVKGSYDEVVYCLVCDTELSREEKEIPAFDHIVVTDKAVASTCTKTGLTEGSHCSVCKTVIKKQNVVNKKAHIYKTTTTQATLSQNGKTETVCTACGDVKGSQVIYYPKTIKLSATKYTYNGKAKTPSVTVKDSKGRALKNGTDYTVAYPKKRKAIGKYTVTVTFKGNYSGTKTLSYEIAPAKVTLSKLTAGSKSLTATWKTVSGVTGYEVQYSTSKKFTKKTTKTATVKKAKTKKTTLKKLKKSKKYYVKVRAYKTVSGKKIYGAWSSVKNIKVK